MYNHFKKIYIVKLTEKYNRDLSLSLNLKPNQTFLINKYKMQARYFTEGELRNILNDMINLDSDYKVRFDRCKYRSRDNTLQLL